MTDGYTVIARLREAEGNRDIPVIVLTAATVSGARYRMIGAGATAFLTKPFDPADLCEAIEAALASTPLPERPAETGIRS